MKRRFDEGYSLVEVLIAIVVLGMLVVPTCASLVAAVRINAAADDMRQAQLAVSSAVEILMAEGIQPEALDENPANPMAKYKERFPDVSIHIDAVFDEETEVQENYFRVRVTSNAEGLDSVCVDTYIPAASVRNPEGEGTP